MTRGAAYACHGPYPRHLLPRDGVGDDPDPDLRPRHDPFGDGGLCHDLDHGPRGLDHGPHGPHGLDHAFDHLCHRVYAVTVTVAVAVAVAVAPSPVTIAIAIAVAVAVTVTTTALIGWRLSAGEALIDVLAPLPGSPKTSSKPPRLPVCHGAAALHVDEDAALVHLPPVGVLVSLFQVPGGIELDEPVATGLPRLIRDNVALHDGAIVFKFLLEILCSDAVVEPGHEQSFERVGCHIDIIRVLW
eukprot:CAMPEP_0114511978 /NCGR_PEP_ID=MMETSP0109-20121206/14708_1 /TAXON_ID=29199 /ORGANISM="Chlorarachnion reptans, Strain CCCM449" /LENGTH=243 /DNA_ID=CAMNT_0001691587 /DNA_START=332 /DNA_END=1061 /DNA_ORIENTATION=-